VPKKWIERAHIVCNCTCRIFAVFALQHNLVIPNERKIVESFGSCFDQGNFIRLRFGEVKWERFRGESKQQCE